MDKLVSQTNGMWWYDVIRQFHEYIDQQNLLSEVIMFALVVLLFVAAFVSYYQYKKYSVYDRQMKMLIQSQQMIDIGFGNLKKCTLSSKGDWPILRKIGVDVPHIETLTFAEIFHRSGMDPLPGFRKMIDDMRAKGETIRIRELELAYEGLTEYVAQSVHPLSDDTFAFYAIDITFSKEEKALLEERADHDNLTNAYRRKAFTDKAEEIRADEDGVLYLAIADIDLFKRVNDDYGHEIGDRVICMVADCMIDMFGLSGCVGRWGGEEFVTVYPAANKEDAVRKMAAYLDVVEQQSVVIDQATGKQVSVTVSAGVTEWTKDNTLRFALSEADTALYTSKKTGRNRVTFFEG